MADYTGKKIRDVCASKLKIEFRKKSHCNGWLEEDGKRRRRITIAHGRNPIKRKTFKAMAGQLSLTVDEFESMLDCTLGRDDVLQKVKEREDNPEF